MYSENNAYEYRQPQYQFFERELPYKSLKLPVRAQGATKMLNVNQRKQEIDDLKAQIEERCRFEELEYLEMLRKEREKMEVDIRAKKAEIKRKNIEQRIAINRKENNEDALDVLISNEQQAEIERQKEEARKKEEEEARRRKAAQKKGRAGTASSSASSSEYSLNAVSRPSSRQPSRQPSQQEDRQAAGIRVMQEAQWQKDIEMRLLKEKEERDMKKKLLAKYHFYGQPGGRRPEKKVIEEEPAVEEEEESNKSQVDWWVRRVLDHKNGQPGKSPLQRGQDRQQELRRPERARYQPPPPKKEQKVLETQSSKKSEASSEKQSEYSYSDSQDERRSREARERRRRMQSQERRRREQTPTSDSD